MRHAHCRSLLLPEERTQWSDVNGRAQYTNLIGVLGRNGRHGLQTLYIEDVKEFYTSEDLPDAYERRELPYYAIEATQLIDRMTHHIGYQIMRPFPSGDHDGRDVEPVKALYEEEPNCVD